ncbi:MAG: efflux RND transporter periplasmic adaptor subunit [Myxococcota bacterium]
MTKRVLLTIGILILVIAPIIAVKASQIMAMISAGESFVPPPESVSSFQVQERMWQTRLTAVGTVTAVRGVTVSTEVPGTVRSILFDSGQNVKTGQVLVRLDTSVEQAQLNASVAAGRLAKVSYERAKALRVMDANSRADFEAAEASALQTDAEVNQVRATIAKKTIRAPFTGRLGIRQVDPGQFLNAGAPVVDLIALKPIYVDFLLPQSNLAVLRTGLEVQVTMDAFADDPFVGRLQNINAKVEEASRNVRIRAELENADEKLRPGMFVDVEVILPDERPVLLIPSTAVLYAPYGNSVYVIEENTEEGGEGLVANQRVVRLGEKRGDFVAVDEGLAGNERVVSAGAFKLQNGMAVVINDEGAPEPSVEPEPDNN